MLTHKELTDKVTSLKASKKYEEDQIRKLEVNFSEQADVSVALFEVIKDLERSIYLLKTKATVVSLNVYKEFLKRLSVCKGNFENTTNNLENVKKLLTYHREKCKNISLELEVLEKELTRYGKLCKYDDHT